MLPDEVRKAVERMDGSLGDWGICRDAWAAVRAHLLAREAEVERLQAELGDYRTNGASAVRFAPNSAHWSNELKRLFGEDARTGIGVLEKWHCDSQARAERAEADLEAANKAVDTYREMLVSIIKVVRERDDRQLQAHIDATGITAHLSENSRELDH